MKEGSEDLTDKSKAKKDTEGDLEEGEILSSSSTVIANDDKPPSSLPHYKQANDGADVAKMDVVVVEAGEYQGSESPRRKGRRARKKKVNMVTSTNEESRDGGITIRPGAVAVPGITLSTVPSRRRTNATGLVSHNEEQEDSRTIPPFFLTAVPIPEDNNLTNLVRRLEYTEEALEQQQLRLQETLSEQRMYHKPTVSGVAVEMVDKDDVSRSTSPNTRRQRVLLILFLVLVVLLVSVTIGVLQRNKKKEEEPKSTGTTTEVVASTPPPSVPTINSTVTNLVERLVGQYPNLDAEVMLMDGTPQNHAIYWMAVEDDWTQEAMKKKDDVRMKMIGERYALAVIYYTTKGEQWKYKSSLFMKAISVCMWKAAGPFDDVIPVDVHGATGTSCNDEDSVDVLDLSEYYYYTPDSDRRIHRLSTFSPPIILSHVVVLLPLFSLQPTPACLESYQQKFPFFPIGNDYIWWTTTYLGQYHKIVHPHRPDVY